MLTLLKHAYSTGLKSSKHAKMSASIINNLGFHLNTVYDNEYSSIINIYFYKTFSTQTSSACALKHFLDTLSDILDKCLRFSLIKIESVSINPSQATLGSLLLSVVYTF